MYTHLRVKAAESADGNEEKIDKRLVNIVDRMFQRCFDDKKFKQVNHLIIIL